MVLQLDSIIYHNLENTDRKGNKIRLIYKLLWVSILIALVLNVSSSVVFLLNTTYSILRNYGKYKFTNVFPSLFIDNLGQYV